MVSTFSLFFPMLRFEAVPEPVKALLVRLAPLVISKDFALGGGTSLALRFGHRWSVDLDFFTTGEFSPEDLFRCLDLDDAFVTGSAKNTLTVDAGGVKIDFLRHAYRMLQPVETIDDIPLISLSDLVAMKLNAIANRGSKKDFYDLAELLDHFSMKQMTAFFAEKYPSSDVFTVIRSLAWFDDAEIQPDPVALNGWEWQSVKKRAMAAVAGL